MSSRPWRLCRCERARAESAPRQAIEPAQVLSARRLAAQALADGHVPRLDRASSIWVAIGTMKWSNATKGYGFIQPEDGGAVVFVHSDTLSRARTTDTKARPI